MRYLLLLSVVVLLAATPVIAAEIRQTAFQRTITKTVRLKYAVFLPDGYDPNGEKTWPTILFLHGAGSRGHDVSKMLNEPPMLYAKKTKGFPFILVAPICPEDQIWYTDTLNALLDEIEADYKVDTTRVYLTGLSMGGTGTWAMAQDYPERFAAVAPVAGRAAPTLIQRLPHMPIWAFHGDKDTTVPIANSELMVQRLKGMKADEVKFTVYKGAGHDIWPRTYNNPELYEWFLKHKRRADAERGVRNAE